MASKFNIFLVGPMGTGKSTIGKVLAELTGLEFVDSDTEIEVRTGADIAWVFDVEGEDGFRQREEVVIDDLTKKNGIILATGGGVVKNKNNRLHLSARGTVVYLETTPEKQYERIGNDKRRPLLNNSNPLQILKDLTSQRDPLYREIADIIVKTDEMTTSQISHEILSKMKDMGINYDEE